MLLGGDTREDSGNVGTMCVEQAGFCSKPRACFLVILCPSQKKQKHLSPCTYSRSAYFIQWIKTNNKCNWEEQEADWVRDSN